MSEEVKAVMGAIPTAFVNQRADIPAALLGLGLTPGAPVLVLIGGADGLRGEEAAYAARAIDEAIGPVATDIGAIVVDGGTDAGVMRMAGATRKRLGGAFQLVGVVGRHLVDLDSAGGGPGTPLEPNHSHLVVVPGETWGDETAWLFDVAEWLADGRPIRTVLLNGGRVARAELAESMRRDIPAIAIRGTGRYADRVGAFDAGRVGTFDAGRETDLDAVPDGPESVSVPEYDGALIEVAEASDVAGLRVRLANALRGAPWTRE